MTTYSLSGCQKSPAIDQMLKAKSDVYGYVSDALRTSATSSAGPVPKGAPSARIVIAAAGAATAAGRHRASRIHSRSAAAMTTPSAMPNCGLIIIAMAPSTPAASQRPRPAATRPANIGSVPTASICPQYGPAKICAGDSIQSADARTALARPAARHTSIAAPSAMAMSAGTLAAFTARRRASPSNSAPSSHSTYRYPGG